MLIKQSCISCRHYGPGQKPAETRCRLRDLVVPDDLAKFAFCHHWTQKATSLPRLDVRSVHGCMDQQLELERALSVNEN